MHGADYAAIVTDDLFQMGQQAADALAKAMGNTGTGKSTVDKIVSGAHPPTSGEISLEGNAVAFADPSIARECGIEVVHQDLALANQQPMYMNLFLGRELTRPPFGFLDRRKMIAQSRELLNGLSIAIPSVRSTIRDMSGGQCQGVPIACATCYAKNLFCSTSRRRRLELRKPKKLKKS